jgi:hypothetical protein
MADTFVVYESSDYGLTWRERVGTDVYQQAYRLAEKFSELGPEIYRVKNVARGEWMVAFRDGQILQMTPPEADAWSRGIHDAPR